MAGLTPQAMEVLKVHHGVATRSMLRDAGVGPDAQRGAIARRQLVVMYERVLRIAAAPESTLARCAALCLACPRSFVTGPTGGRMGSLRRMPRDEIVHLSTPHGSNIGPLDGVLLRQTTRIHPSDVQRRRPDGIVLASAPRLVFDLGADLTATDHASVVEQILHERRRRLISDPGTRRPTVRLGDQPCDSETNRPTRRPTVRLGRRASDSAHGASTTTRPRPARPNW